MQYFNSMPGGAAVKHKRPTRTGYFTYLGEFHRRELSELSHVILETARNVAAGLNLQPNAHSQVVLFPTLRQSWT